VLAAPAGTAVGADAVFVPGFAPGAVSATLRVDGDGRAIMWATMNEGDRGRNVKSFSARF
jgi:hypothetical protein